MSNVHVSKLVWDISMSVSDILNVILTQVQI